MRDEINRGRGPLQGNRISRVHHPTVPLEEGDRPRSGQGESDARRLRDRGFQRCDAPPGAAARRLSPSSRGTVGMRTRQMRLPRRPRRAPRLDDERRKSRADYKIADRLLRALLRDRVRTRVAGDHEGRPVRGDPHGALHRRQPRRRGRRPLRHPSRQLDQRHGLRGDPRAALTEQPVRASGRVGSWSHFLVVSSATSRRSPLPQRRRSAGRWRRSRRRSACARRAGGARRWRATSCLRAGPCLRRRRRR